MQKEAQEQAMIFAWAKYKPELKWLFAIPNGGSRHLLEAINLKRQGVKKGVADMALLLPKGKYYGLLIELKVGNNKPSAEQTEFLINQNLCGYCAVVCYGHQETIEVIEKYLGGKDLSKNVRGLEKWALKYGLNNEWKSLLNCI